MLVGLCALTVGGWIGLGGPPSLAVARQRSTDGQGAAEREQRLSALRWASRLGSLNATGHLAVARAALQNADSLDEAVGASERAVAAPYLHAWSEMFEARVMAAEARLTRRLGSADLVAASGHLAEARGLFERNARLDRRLAVAAYYNSAVVGALSGEARHLLAAYLATAVSVARTLDPSGQEAAAVARLALDEGDLRGLRLELVPSPSRRLVERLSVFNGPPATIAARAVQAGVAPDEVFDFFAAYVRAAAQS